MYLLVGGNSEIGGETAHQLAARGQTVVTTTRRTAEVGPTRVLLDFDRPTDGFEPPPGVTAACIFVAVARLAACQADPTGSALINCERTIALVDRLLSRGVYTLFLSTNQVFDGETAHVAADAPHSPRSEYGRQKARTEAALKARIADGAPVGILRLAKVASPGMALVAGWREKLAAGEPIRAFHDMTMAPTPTAMVASAIAGMMRERFAGIAQLTGPRDVTYAEIGRFLARRAGVSEDRVEAVSALDNGMPEGGTPRNTTLDSSLVATRYGLTVPDTLDVVAAL